MQRQLNLYGFKCISRGDDKGAFFHPKFRRGDWEEVKRITRYSPNKKNGEDKMSENFLMKIEPASKPLDAVVAAAESMYSQIVQVSNQNYSANPAPSMHYPSFNFNNDSGIANVSNNAMDYPSFLTNAVPNAWYNSVSVANEYVPAMSINEADVGDVVKSRDSGVVVMQQESMVSSVSVPVASLSSPVNAVLPELKTTIVAERSSYIHSNGSRAGGSNKNVVKVVNDVVTIDPYFDFENEFDFLCDAMSEGHEADDGSSFASSPSMSSAMSMGCGDVIVTVYEKNEKQKQSGFEVKDTVAVATSPSVTMSATMPAVLEQTNKKTTCEIGINTDLSQANVGPLAAELMFMFPRSF